MPSDVRSMGDRQRELLALLKTRGNWAPADKHGLYSPSQIKEMFRRLRQRGLVRLVDGVYYPIGGDQSHGR